MRSSFWGSKTKSKIAISSGLLEAGEGTIKRTTSQVEPLQPSQAQPIVRPLSQMKHLISCCSSMSYSYSFTSLYHDTIYKSRCQTHSEVSDWGSIMCNFIS